MGGLVDSIWAIEWAGSIVSWGGKMLMGDVKWGVADIGKGIASNAVGRFIKSKNDPNNIIRAIFEKWGNKSILPNIPNKPTNGNIPRNSTNPSPVLDMGTAKKVEWQVKKPAKVKPKVQKPSPQVKPVEKKVLTPKKESATMGDMETKKLIEEARKTPVYHWTNVEFKDFDPKRINTVESSGDYIGEWFYFTTSKESAKKYAQQAVKKKWGKEVIKEVTLDMKKPFIINSKSDIQKLNDIFWWEDNRIELLLDNPKAVREKLQSLGYDWLIDNLYWQRAVFNAKQIMSK